MTKSNSREEDARRAAASKGRVDSEHGGELVEAVAPGDLESFNDPDCKHDNLVRDESETEFNAFICTNPKCNEVVLFNKT
jgi:hypothetical protein